MGKAVIVLALIARTAAASHCHEVSPIHGREHCGHFGARWAHQPYMGLFSYEVGAMVARVALPALDETGTVYNRTGSATYHATAPSARLTAIGPRQRMGFRGPHAVFALEMAGGWALKSPTLTTELPDSTTTSSGATFFDLALVVGLHTRVGPFELGAELPLGVRFLGVGGSLPGGYTLCEGGSNGKGCSYAVGENQALAELRVRVDAWVDPQVTIGIAAGYDVVAGGQTYALVIGYRAQLFDGQ